MLDINKPVQTRDGRKARIICTDMNANLPIVALVQFYDREEESVVYFYSDGRLYKNNSSNTSAGDLINVPEKHVGYLNIYTNSTEYFTSRVLADAGNQREHQLRVACIRVEFQEGQFDE